MTSPSGPDDRDSDRNSGRDPGDYGAPRSTPPRSPSPVSPRERLSADYDDEPPPRRSRPAGNGGAQKGERGASAFLGATFSGGDPATRKLVGGAAAIGALLLAAVGGWSLFGGHQGGIPVIGPPPGPVRDRPADPGGMQVMDAQDAATDMTGNGEAHLAPAPEQPDTKALARQYGLPPAGSAAPAESAKPAEAPASPPPAAPAGEKPAEEKPAPAPPPPPAKPAPKPQAPKAESAKAENPGAAGSAPLPPPVPADDTAQAAPETGAFEVQLAALDSESAARGEWDTLRRQAPALFAGHTPLFRKATRDGKTFVRLRIGGFADAKAARAYCVKLHVQSIACTPVGF